MCLFGILLITHLPWRFHYWTSKTASLYPFWFVHLFLFPISDSLHFEVLPDAFELYLAFWYFVFICFLRKIKKTGFNGFGELIESESIPNLERVHSWDLHSFKCLSDNFLLFISSHLVDVGWLFIHFKSLLVFTNISVQDVSSCFRPKRWLWDFLTSACFLFVNKRILDKPSLF